ncbi:MAG: hypothetical protein ACK5HY_12010, partial [Parahaliea sp.]
GRLILALIAGIPVTVILVASWLWYFVARGDIDILGTLGTANRGTLVQPPRQLAGQDWLQYQDGTGFVFGDLERKWTFVVPSFGATCDEHCEHLLYLTRQIHLAMGKEYNRIQRFYVSDVPLSGSRLAVAELSDGNDLPADFAGYLQREHGQLLPLRASAPVLASLFAEHVQAPDTWYLVDPAGWVMMSYDSSVSYKEVIADLKFLLKNASN